AALLVPSALFALVYIGSPIPNSVIAKRVIGNEYDITSLPHLLEHLAWNGPFFGWSFPFVPLAGCLAFAVGAVAFIRRPVPALRLLVMFPLAFSAVLYLGRAP